MTVPLMVGIAGPSCAGKSQLAHALADRLPGVSVLAMDRYYCDLSQLCMDERARQNFDHPDALEWPRLMRDLEALAQGLDVMAPKYDYTYHEREAIEEKLVPSELVIVEGLYALYTPELRALYDLRVFISHSAEECMARRVQRDVETRGRAEDSVCRQFRDTVWPMYALHIESTRTYADLVLSGSGTVNEMVDAVLRALPRRPSAEK